MPITAAELQTRLDQFRHDIEAITGRPLPVFADPAYRPPFDRATAERLLGEIVRRALSRSPDTPTAGVSEWDLGGAHHIGVASATYLCWYAYAELDGLRTTLTDEGVLPSERLEILEHLEAHTKDAYAQLRSNWVKLTGQPYSLERDPDLSVLTSTFADISLSHAWDPANYQAENRLLRTPVRPAPHAPREAHGDTHPAPRRTQHEVRPGCAVPWGRWGRSRDLAEREHRRNGDCAPGTLRAAVGNFPEVVQEGSDTSLYTFPHRLGSREDIFYDYSVILPLDSTGSVDTTWTDDDLDRTDYLAAEMLARKALGVIEPLERAGPEGLAALFGGGVIESLKEDLRSLVSEVNHPGTNDRRVRDMKGKAAQWSGIMRVLSDSETMKLAELDTYDVEVPSFTKNAATFASAVRNAPTTATTTILMPKYAATRGLTIDALTLTYSNGRQVEPPSPRHHSGDWGGNCYHDAAPSTLTMEITTYLAELGGAFREAYTELRSAAEAVVRDLADVQGGDRIRNRKRLSQALSEAPQPKSIRVSGAKYGTSAAGPPPMIDALMLTDEADVHKPPSTRYHSGHWYGWCYHDSGLNLDRTERLGDYLWYLATDFKKKYDKLLDAAVAVVSDLEAMEADADALNQAMERKSAAREFAGAMGSKVVEIARYLAELLEEISDHLSCDTIMVPTIARERQSGRRVAGSRADKPTCAPYVHRAT